VSILPAFKLKGMTKKRHLLLGWAKGKDFLKYNSFSKTKNAVVTS
jgi:hypothetical protein